MASQSIQYHYFSQKYDSTTNFPNRSPTMSSGFIITLGITNQTSNPFVIPILYQRKIILSTLSPYRPNMTAVITTVPRLYVKVYLKNQAIPPGIFRTGVMDFRPYGDAIPQSVNVPCACQNKHAQGFVTERALIHDGLAPDDIRLLFQHTAIFACSFRFPSVRTHGLPSCCRPQSSSGLSQYLTPVTVPTHYR